MICTIFAVLSHLMLFCCKISLLCNLRCFVTKSVLSRFMRFGVEKNWAKNFVCGEKSTNMRYILGELQNVKDISEIAKFHRYYGNCKMSQILRKYKKCWQVGEETVG